MSSQRAPDEPGADPRADNTDVALALALAAAARTVAYVVDLGAGRYGVAATYGPGQRITGIVLHRPTPSAGGAAPAFVVEAHIVVAMAAVTSVMVPAAQQKKPHLPSTRAHRTEDMGGSPILLRIADETRRALATTLRRLRPNEQWDIDITIDDLCDSEARTASVAE
jgi:hypothetical protein